MSLLLLHADRALTPSEEIRDAAILIEDGKITSVGQRSAISVPAGARVHKAPGLTVVPGFVDVHIHGAGGHDVMEGLPDALSAIASTLARNGTTSFLATTVTAQADSLCRSVEGIASYMSRQTFAGQSSASAELLGIHLEGPFISAARRGVHPAAWIAPPCVALLKRILDAAMRSVRLVTLAPELPGALELISIARQAGLIVALGHTDATFEEASAAIAAGAHHAVHVFNAMRPFSHRETGVLGAILTSPEVTAELIADGVHVDPPAMRLLLSSKGASHVLLVSDGTAATGMPDGQYRLGEIEVTVKEGICRNSDGRLAGSTLTLDRAIRNVVALGVPLTQAVQMATLNPARLLGLEKKKGVLALGADADLVLLDEKLRVADVMTRGVGLVA
mgnify:CR=1 FL=1